ncbi:hypothetical protein M3Y99_00172800 [Aphelenchoides fujianensis]|nr:hypothetical protein M3Y99_00172800 [Aphelenchoides fujianensis]
MPTAYELLANGAAPNGQQAAFFGDLNGFSQVLNVNHRWRSLSRTSPRLPAQEANRRVLVPNVREEPPLSLYHLSMAHVNDFGHVIRLGAENLSDADKLRFLVDFFRPPPPPAHEWPAETRLLNGKADRYCALFPPENPAFANSRFIKQPFHRFSHMFGNGGAIKKHINRRYHQEAEQKAEERMFKKQFSANNTSNLRSRDRKELFAKLPQLAAERLKAEASSTSHTKIVLSNGIQGNLYVNGKDPVLFDLNKNPRLYPDPLLLVEPSLRSSRRS